MGTKKMIYAWTIGLLWMISFTACSSSSPKEVPSASNAALNNIFARKSVRTYLDKGSRERENRLDVTCRYGCSVRKRPSSLGVCAGH